MKSSVFRDITLIAGFFKEHHPGPALLLARPMKRLLANLVEELRQC